MAVYAVTNLNDTGSGSFRDCLSKLSSDGDKIVFDDSIADRSEILVGSRLYRQIQSGAVDIVIDTTKSDGTPRKIVLNRNHEEPTPTGFLILRNINCTIIGLVFRCGCDTSASNSGASVTNDRTSTYTPGFPAHIEFKNCAFIGCADNRVGCVYAIGNSLFENCVFYGNLNKQGVSTAGVCVTTYDGQITARYCTFVNNVGAVSSNALGAVGDAPEPIVEHCIDTANEDAQADFLMCPAPYDYSEYEANPLLPDADFPTLKLYPTYNGKYGGKTNTGERERGADFTGLESSRPFYPDGAYNVFSVKQIDEGTEYTFADVLPDSLSLPALSFLGFSDATIGDWNGEQTSEDVVLTGAGVVLASSTDKLINSESVTIEKTTLGELTLSSFLFVDNTDKNASVLMSTTGTGKTTAFYYRAEDNWIKAESVSVNSLSALPETPDAACWIRYCDGYKVKEDQAPRTYYYIGSESEGSFKNKNDWSLTEKGTGLSVAPTVEGCKFNVKL